MAYQALNLGTAPNDRSGDNLRAGGEKINANFTELYALHVNSLIAISTLTPAANKLPYYSGASTAALADLTAFGRTLIGSADAAAARTSMALGTAALEAVGTTGSVIGKLDGANSWTATQTMTGLSVARTGSTQTLAVSTDAGFSARLTFQSAGVARWHMGRNSTTESGSNAGSNFFMTRLADDGSTLATTITITRSTGDISIEGNVTPVADNSKTLGSGSFRWSVVYAATGTINTSDERAKRDILAISDVLLDAWGDVEWRTYRMVDAFEQKGDGARWHFGLIAQRVRDAIDGRMGEGSAIRLGLVCHDIWDAQEEVTEPEVAPREVEEPYTAFVPAGPVRKDGTRLMKEVERTRTVISDVPTGNNIVISPALPAGDRWGLRYDECFALEAAWQRREIARQDERLKRIEAAIQG